jgi:hypothetical protein
MRECKGGIFMKRYKCFDECESCAPFAPPSSHAAPLTVAAAAIAPLAGGTEPVSAHLTILQLQ